MSGRREPPFSGTNRRAPRSPLATSRLDPDQVASPAPSTKQFLERTRECPGAPVPSPACHALGTWPRAPGSPDLRGQAQEAWAGPSVTGRSPVVSRPPRCPQAFLGQELGSRGPRPGQPPARRAECRPHRGRSLQLCRGGPGDSQGPQGSQAAFQPQTPPASAKPPPRSGFSSACVQVSTLGGPRAHGPP